MRRFATHAAWIGAFAFGASILVHGVGVVGLAEIHERGPAPHARSRASELEYIEMPPLEAEATPPEVPSPPEVAATPDVAEAVDDESVVAIEVAAATPTPAQESPVLPIIPPPPEPEPEPEPEQPPTQVAPQQSVEQTSDDPSVPPPENAQYLAAENRRVEQETQAREARLDSDTPESTPPPQSDSIVESTDDGADSSATRESDMTQGDERQAAEGDTSTEDPTETTESRPATTPHVGVQTEGRTAEAMAGARATGTRGSGGTPAPEMEAITIDDGFGTFTVMRPRRAATGGASGESGPRGEGGPSRERGGAGPNLRIGFSALEAIYGPEQLAAERAARREAREALASASGAHRQERWEQFRFAAENFLPTVTPGNQTALNAAASPFAAWISAVHRRIHSQFAERFLQRIQRQGGEFANEDLYTELEIVIDVRGRVLRVAITHTSGLSAFDLGAFSSVIDAQPYPVPPDVILSGDGNVYTKWGFSRGPSACTSQQAAPFILPNPPPLVPMPGVTIDPDEAARARRRHTPIDLQGDDVPAIRDDGFVPDHGHDHAQP